MPTTSASLFVLLLLSSVDALRLPPASALREYEKKHGRVALVSVAALGGLAASGVDAPTAWLSTLPVDDQLCFFAGAAMVEAAATLPRFGDNLSLRDDVTPGAFWEAEVDPRIDAAEDWAGRAAMLTAAGALAQGAASAVA